MKIPVLLALLLVRVALAQAVPAGSRLEQSLELLSESNDPLSEQVLIDIQGPKGPSEQVRAFWDGGRTWRFRLAPAATGVYRWRAVRQDVKPVSGDLRATRAQIEALQPSLSPDRRYLVQRGKPWFFLSDTAWNGALLSTNEEWRDYVADRKAKRFTAVQFVMTQWRAGRQDETGAVAFSGANPVRVNPAFFARMDRKFDVLNDAGLVAVPVMLWALTSKDNESPGVALSSEDAIRLARYMADRYHAHAAIWMLGGDGDYSGENVARWKAIGSGVFGKGPNRQPVGMHPRGMRAPWEPYKDEPWLDVLFYQSGHGGSAAKWKWNATAGPAVDWRLTPRRPVIDAEPNYEAHLGYDGKKIDDYDVRRAAYYSLLAGPPAGVSYGAHGIWFWSRKAEVPLDHPKTGVAEPWRVCLNYEGAEHMKVLRNLFDTFDWWRLRPDRSILAEDKFDEESFRDYSMAAVSDRRDFALLYLPVPGRVAVNASALKGSRSEARWLNPRTGEQTRAGTFAAGAAFSLETPSEGDWLLLVRAR